MLDIKRIRQNPQELRDALKSPVVWIAAATILIVLTWVALGPMNAEETAAHAERRDVTTAYDGIVICAGTASRAGSSANPRLTSADLPGGGRQSPTGSSTRSPPTSAAYSGCSRIASAPGILSQTWL